MVQKMGMEPVSAGGLLTGGAILPYGCHGIGGL